MDDQSKNKQVSPNEKMEGQFAASISRKPIKCPQCRTMNQGTKKVCKKCGADLTAQ